MIAENQCKSCRKKFKGKDEVAVTDAYGSKDLVHVTCLHDYVLGASMQEYYDTYKEYLAERE